jgi:hypothetical protein
MHFKKFLSDIKEHKEYDDVRLMIYHLFTESFFRFTIKNKLLALDYGTPENEHKDNFDFTSAAIFWKEIDEEISKISNIDIVELRKLFQLREGVMKKYEKILPEVDIMSQVLSEFDEFRESLEKFKRKDSDKVNRREIFQVCREFLKAPSASSVSQNNIESDSDLDTTLAEKQKNKRKKTNKSPEKSKTMECSSSEDEPNKQHLLRTRACTTQKMTKTINAFENPDKLRQCYE